MGDLVVAHPCISQHTAKLVQVCVATSLFHVLQEPAFQMVEATQINDGAAILRILLGLRNEGQNVDEVRTTMQLHFGSFHSHPLLGSLICRGI